MNENIPKSCCGISVGGQRIMKLHSAILIVFILISSFPFVCNIIEEENIVAGGNVLYVGDNATHKTIQSAVDSATDGDTIIIKNSTYNENVIINTPNLTLIGNSTLWPTNVTGNSDAAFTINADGVEIISFNITTTSDSVNGIIINNANICSIVNTTIQTSGSGSHGILINNSQNNIISNNSITTQGSNAHGLNLTNLTSITADGLNITTTHSTAAALMAENSSGAIFNSTLDAQNSDEIRLYYGSNVSVTNVSFNTIDASHSFGGVLWVHNYLDIYVYQNESIGPLEGADVLVLDNGLAVYKSTGYGGLDNPTGTGGTVPTLTVVDRWYPKSNVALENQTTVKVKKSEDAFWEEEKDVDMSSSHPEDFISTDISAPNIPAGLTVTQEGKSQMNISWTANIDDTETYSIYTNRSGTWDLIKNITNSNTSYIDNYPFTHGVKYYYKISAWDEVPLESLISTNKSTVYSDDFAPPTPSGLYAKSDANQDRINITWTLNPGFDTISYKIYTNKSGDWGELHPDNPEPQGKNYSYDIDVVHGQTYYYKISAQDSIPNESPLSDHTFAVHADYIAPPMPSGLNVTSVINGDALKISWHPNNGDSAVYSIYSNRTGEWDLLQNITHPATSYHDNNDLINGTTYYYKISAWDEVPLESQHSEIFHTVHIDQVKPSAPAGLKAINATGTSIDLTWELNTELDLEGYIIYMNRTEYDTDKSYKNITAVNSTTTKYKVTNLSEETTYYFVIRAFDEVPNLSNESKEAGNTTLDVTPPNAPDMAYLPEYTNDTDLRVHGVTEPNATVKVIRNSIEAGEEKADNAGDFDIDIVLEEGENHITAFAIDTKGNPGIKSPVQTVVLDRVLPHAYAGRDRLEENGTILEFNASGSYDEDVGIKNYTWRFTYDNKTYKIYGKLASFQFDLAGDYSVVLRVTDHAGNWREDIVRVYIVEGELDRIPPEIILNQLYPGVDSTNIPIKLTIRIPFNENVSIDTLEINISANLNENPDTDLYDVTTGEIEYDELNWTIIYTPERDLLYNTTYDGNLTIEDSFWNELSFKWSFTTEIKPTIPPDTTPPEVDNTQFYKKNDRLPVDGQIKIPFSEPLNESTIELTITDSSGNVVLGDWVYDSESRTIVFTPDEPLKPGEKYTVTIDAADTSGNEIPSESGTFSFTTEEKKAEDSLSPFLMWMMISVIIVVIIMIIVVLAVQRRGREKLEEEVEDKPEVEEELLDEFSDTEGAEESEE